MSKKPDPDFDGQPGPGLYRARWRFGEFELDESRRELRRRGELLTVEPKPLNLLMLLLRHPGELILKNDLIDALWTGRIVVDAVLGNCVAKLRQVLGEEAGGAIKTVHGFGYRFDCQAELLADQGIEIAAPKLTLETGASVAQRPNWVLVRRLGRSGDSWLAEHVKTRARRVFKFTTDPLGLSALKREVTIFRLLRESLGGRICYVELLDWNFDEPPWFIETEYCSGGSLQEWFETQGGVSKVPLATRLELIAQIAEALADIHVIGVLHKDLKPANVFVVPGEGGAPHIRLADFGSGRLLDSGRLAALEITRMGFTQVIDTDNASSGTPLYLAPELLAGQPATVKADIYALGVMLYQCVIGNLRRPLAAGWEQSIDDEMLRDDIAAAAEGNPDRRLANAAELALSLRSIEKRRIEREAQREVQARLERESRALERMRARRVGLMLAFAALAIGFVVSASLYLDARKARRLAEAQTLRAEAETKRAEKVAAFLGEDMFREVNTNEHPVKNLSVKELLDSATAAVDKRFEDELDIQAKVYESLGRAYSQLEQDVESARNIERAQALHRQLEGDAGDGTLALTEELVHLEYPIGRLAANIEQYQAIEKAGEERLSSKDFRVIKLRVALASGRVQLGEWARGEAELLAAYTDLKSSGIDNPSFEIGLERSLARVQSSLAKYVDAERHLLSVSEKVVQLYGNKHYEYALTRVFLAEVLYQLGHYAESESELAGAETIANEWAKADGTLPLTIKLYRAWLRIKQDRPKEAITPLIEIKQAMIESNSQQLDQSFSEDQPLGLAYLKLGDFQMAESIMRSALRSSSKSLGDSHPMTLSIRLDLADILVERGNKEEAQRILAPMPKQVMDDLPRSHPMREQWEHLVHVLDVKLVSIQVSKRRAS